MEYLFLRRKKTSGTSVRQKALLYRAAGREWTARFSSLSDVRPADSLIYKGILYQLEIRLFPYLFLGISLLFIW